MKALELAEKLEEAELTRAISRREPVGVEFFAVAAELRRLAEVNSNLLKAVNDLSVTAESTKPGEFSVASHALFALQDTANKAKGL